MVFISVNYLQVERTAGNKNVKRVCEGWHGKDWFGQGGCSKSR